MQRMMDSSLTVNLILMLVLFHLRFSSAYVYQDTAKKTVLPASKQSEVKKAKSLGYVREESDDGVPAVAEAADASFMIRGRKMLSPKGLSEASKLKHLDAGDSEIPGTDACASEQHPARISQPQQLLNQNEGVKLKPKSNTAETDITAVGLSEIVQNERELCSQDSASDSSKCSSKLASRFKEFIHGESYNGTPDHPSTKLAESAEEIVSLTTKDYPPHHKPPINNHVPLNERQTIP